MRLKHSAPEKIADDAEIILSAGISYGNKKSAGKRSHALSCALRSDQGQCAPFSIFHFSSQAMAGEDVLSDR
jgi:hypothetical protein